jgi:hypothetical protein
LKNDRESPLLHRIEKTSVVTKKRRTRGLKSRKPSTRITGAACQAKAQISMPMPRIRGTERQEWDGSQSGIINHVNLKNFNSKMLPFWWSQFRSLGSQITDARDGLRPWGRTTF